MKKSLHMHTNELTCCLGKSLSCSILLFEALPWWWRRMQISKCIQGSFFKYLKHHNILSLGLRYMKLMWQLTNMPRIEETCCFVFISQSTCSVIVANLLSLFFWLWHRKVTFPFFIPPTKLWLVSCFSDQGIIHNEHYTYLNGSKIGHVGSNSEVWK